MSSSPTRPAGSLGEGTVVSVPQLEFFLDDRTVDRIRTGLGAIFACLALGGGIGVLLIHTSEAETAQDVGRFLALGTEQGPGTWIASTLLLGCAMLAAVGALVARRTNPRWARSWWVLAFAFGVVSFDEVADVHGRLSPAVSRLLGDTSGFLTFAWVLPAIALGLAFLLYEVPFLRHLGSAGRDLVVAGTLFVVGAVGLEMIEGDLVSQGQRESPAYDLYVLTEELLEFGSTMWATMILVGYLRRTLGNPTVHVVRGRSSAAI